MNTQVTMADAYQLLHDGILAFANTERNGIRIDIDYCNKTQKKLDKKIEHLEDIFKATKFYHHWFKVFNKNINIYSPQQLSHLLYTVRKLKAIRETNTGQQGATDDETLTQLGIPALKTLVDIRRIKNQKNHLNGFAREVVGEYMHPFFNLHTVRTFRGSSDRPNFQNIPKRDEQSMRICRQAIIPRKGHLIMEADFKGMEVRVSACYHKDPNMIKYIVDKSTDMHRDYAQELFFLKRFDKSIHGHDQLRQATKNGFIFPQFYGDYYVGCAENMAFSWGKLPRGRWKSGQGILIEEGLYLSDLLINAGIKSFDQFVEHVKKIEQDFWGHRFRVYKRWKDQWWESYQEKGYFDTLTGFRCSGIMSRNDTTNYPVQGSAFHCLLWVYIQVDKIARKEKWRSRLMGQIHDSMVLDVHPKEFKHVYQTIERLVQIELPKHWKWIIVPMEIEFETCDIDKPWSEKRPYKLAA